MAQPYAAAPSDGMVHPPMSSSVQPTTSWWRGLVGSPQQSAAPSVNANVPASVIDRALEKRLDASPAEEYKEALRQVHHIARFRLLETIQEG